MCEQRKARSEGGERESVKRKGVGEGKRESEKGGASRNEKEARAGYQATAPVSKRATERTRVGERGKGLTLKSARV
eukprot:3153208-Pleurochrysis_carterae.AAC.1